MNYGETVSFENPQYGSRVQVCILKINNAVETDGIVSKYTFVKYWC